MRSSDKGRRQQASKPRNKSDQEIALEKSSSTFCFFVWHKQQVRVVSLILSNLAFDWPQTPIANIICGVMMFSQNAHKHCERIARAFEVLSIHLDKEKGASGCQGF